MAFRHVRSFLLASAAAALLIALASPSVRAADNGDELKCQLGTSLAVGKFVRAKAGCIDGCQKKAFANGEIPNCSPPYSGSTFGCVNAAEGDAGGEIQSSCSKDCPECYSGGDCKADADAKVADAEAHVDALAADVFCDDSASADGLTLSEFKCQRTVRKFITKFAAAKLKCFARCKKAESGGRLSPGSCDQPPSDPKTQACLSKIEGKTAFIIDKKCEPLVNPSADKPECGPYPTRDGAGWVAAEEAEVDARVTSIFCEDTATTTTTVP